MLSLFFKGSTLCSWFGHQWFSYEEAPYKDCTRCGATTPDPKVKKG